MKRLTMTALLLLCGTAFAATPKAENVTISGVGSREVTITYTLTAAPVVVTLDIETNTASGAWVSIGGEHIQRVSGDVNRQVSGKGTYTISWLPDRDWPGNLVESGRARAVVTAWPLDNTPDYLVVNLLTTTNLPTARYYTSTNFLPGGLFSNPAYRTSSILMRKILAKDVTWTMGSSPLELGRDPSAAGAEAPHEVTLTNDYYIGVFEVTQKQWETVTEENPADFKGDMRPVEQVSYNEIRVSATKTASAADYTNYDWPNDPCGDSFLGKLRTQTQVDFDLPSEAQWEFACRAGLQVGCEVWKNGCWNDGTKIQLQDGVDSNLVKLGRYKSNQTDGVGGTANGTAPSGSYAPNSWGLYDMHGNVIEWCLDWFAVDITALNGAVNTTVAAGHARRDGAWNNPAKYQRMAVRASNTPDSQYSSVGLRLACRAGLR